MTPFYLFTRRSTKLRLKLIAAAAYETKRAVTFMPEGLIWINNGRYELNPNFEFGPKPPIPAKNPNRGLQSLPLQHSIKPSPRRQPRSRHEVSSFGNPQTPTKTSSRTTFGLTLPVNKLTVGSTLVVTIKKMSEASQDRVTADGHLQTQSVSRFL